jgi:hypothetical protein
VTVCGPYSSQVGVQHTAQLGNPVSFITHVSGLNTTYF